LEELIDVANAARHVRQTGATGGGPLENGSDAFSYQASKNKNQIPAGAPLRQDAAVLEEQIDVANAARPVRQTGAAGGGAFQHGSDAFCHQG
jgi:hypothetical protein